MSESSENGKQSSDGAGLLGRVGRRDLLMGATVGALGLGAAGTADAASSPVNSNRSGSENDEGGPPFAPRDHSHDGDLLGIEEPVASIAARVINNVHYVDVAEGAQAVQDVIDEANAEGTDKVVVYGDEGEWNTTVLVPSNFTLEFQPGVTVTSSIDVDAADTFEVGAGTNAAALIRNEDAENGNENITIRGGHIDFSNADTEGAVWAPVWLCNCDDGLFDSITVENAHDRGGVMFTDCRDSIMKDCVTRNIGYDGIALTLDCRRCDVYRCEAYECGGPGIQAATFGRGAGAPQDVNFINCRTSEMIAVHGYEIAGGAQNVTFEGCAARRLGIIGEVTDFRISDCDVDTVALSALSETIRNGRIDSVTFGGRYDDPPTATILWGFDNALIENISFSDCTAHGLERFVECRLNADSATSRYIDYTSTAFDGAGADTPRTFVQNHSEGELSNIRIHGGKIWNADTVVEGELDGLRIRDTELHQVDDLHDGDVTDLETRDVDEW